MAKVIVCGVKDGEVTEDGCGWQEFDSLKDAQEVFPDLDIDHNGKRFTWGLKNGEKIRFETWAAYRLYST